MLRLAEAKEGSAGSPGQLHVLELCHPLSRNKEAKLRATDYGVGNRNILLPAAHTVKGSVGKSLGQWLGGPSLQSQGRPKGFLVPYGTVKLHGTTQLEQKEVSELIISWILTSGL